MEIKIGKIPFPGNNEYNLKELKIICSKIIFREIDKVHQWASSKGSYSMFRDF